MPAKRGIGGAQRGDLYEAGLALPPCISVSRFSAVDEPVAVTSGVRRLQGFVGCLEGANSSTVEGVDMEMDNMMTQKTLHARR